MGKWTDFVISYGLILSITDTLSIMTNTLAYYGIRTLRIRNVFIIQAPSQKLMIYFHHFVAFTESVIINNGLFTRPISECDFALRWFILEKTNL
jgi:hypothetical protein